MPDQRASLRSAKEADKAWFAKLMKIAGITPNGPNPWDPQIHNEAFYKRVRWQNVIGLGESYMDGWWDCEQLDEFFARLLRGGVQKAVGLSFPIVFGFAKAAIMNLQSVRRAFNVGKHHYDLGNDLFTAMLGPSMAYSCGYFKNTDNLDEAQNAKYELICQKLKLQPGMTVLDIGCGWGGLAKYLAQHYGVKVVGLTISEEQAKFAAAQCQGLPVRILFQDYRSFNEKVDRVVSVGMWEHIGYRNYRAAMKMARACLADEGLFLLHTINGPVSTITMDPWAKKYIFPDAMIPSIKQMAKSAEGLFLIEDVHNFGPYYDKTLMAWHDNFVAAWPSLKGKYDDRFYRMWVYYLKSCAGAFRARIIGLTQIVLSPKGVLGGYESVR